MKRNLPYDDETDRELFDNSFHAASMSDCTGLIPTAPENESEIRSYSDIFDIPLPNYRNDRRSIMNEQNRNEQNRNSNRKDDQNRKDNQNSNRKDNQSSNKKDDQNSNKFDRNYNN